MLEVLAPRGDPKIIETPPARSQGLYRSERCGGFSLS